MDQSTIVTNLPSAQYLNAHHWTNHEKVFKRKERICSEIEHLEIPLRAGLLYKVSKSVFGPFVRELNTSQHQDYILNDNKLQILNFQLKKYTEHDLNIIKHRNLFIKDYYSLLQKSVNCGNTIDINFLEKNLKSLFLDCAFIKQLDNTLFLLENLQVLTLCGNYLTVVKGALLPRKLMFLELFDNFISDLSSLIRGLPQCIMHLGLGRNRLTDKSKFHLLSSDKGTLSNLKCLDLSDNELCSLTTLLSHLEKLSGLKSFLLQGNPCSLLPNYKSDVLARFSKLDYLDAIGVLDSDFVENSPVPQETHLVFHCYRLLGLPQPPKDKKNLQTIHIEANFPLLIENVGLQDTPAALMVNDEVMVPNDENRDKGGGDKRPKKDKSKENSKEKGSKLNGGNRKKKKSYYSGSNEFDEAMEEKNVWFKSERVEWSKIMEFSPMEITGIDNSIIKIRDCFRSIVPVRIIYLKIAPFSTKIKKKKGESNNKGKSKKEKQDKNKANTDTTDEVEETPKEHVLKKLTIASFYCELQSLNWSDKSVDFYWADHPDMGDKALKVEGSLQAIEYDVSSCTVKKKAKGEGRRISSAAVKACLPNVLTCQVGFGLNRT